MIMMAIRSSRRSKHSKTNGACRNVGRCGSHHDDLGDDVMDIHGQRMSVWSGRRRFLVFLFVSSLPTSTVAGLY